MSQCTAETRSGSRCKRQAQEGSETCYMHGTEDASSDVSASVEQPTVTNHRHAGRAVVR